MWAIIIFTFESIHCSVEAVLKLLNIVVFLHMNCDGTEMLYDSIKALKQKYDT